MGARELAEVAFDGAAETGLARRMATLVVTGASGALGGAIARELVRRGHRVAAVASPRSEKRLRDLEAELGAACLGLAFDAAAPGGWEAALARIDATLGPPGGAVLAAGGWRGGAPHHEALDATWAAMIDANLDTVRRALAAILPGLVARRAGSIVVVGSRAAVQPWSSAGAAAYAASKAAAVALVQAVAAEVASAAVRVNAVLPSTLDTPANRAAMPGADPSGWVSTDSVARVIAFLLSDDARDVTGAALPIFGLG